MKNKLLRYLIVTAVLVSSVLAMGTPVQPPPLNKLQDKIAAELNQMDADLAQAAEQLAATGLKGDEASKILYKLFQDHASAIDIATIDPDGTLLLIEPGRYKESEGSSIKEQSHFPRMQTGDGPILSGLFRTVENFNAVSLAYPVKTADGKLIGFVSIVFKPDALMKNAIQADISGISSLEVLAIETDGQVIYSRDILQIGKMTFTDQAYQSYPSLLKLANRITAESFGTGTYTFPPRYGNVPIQKACEWSTISLHGTDWRLVLATTKD
jgi:hypothetical protein